MNTHPTHARLLRKNCALITAFLSLALGLSAQTLAPTAAAPVDPVKVPVQIATTPAKSEEVIELSPFSVVANTKGYQSFNTLSGTRLKSKLADLAASITVVTKQQMLDTAVLDINDVFRYEASTEGTNNFTSFNRNRSGGVNDQVQSDPQKANRIRGVSASGQSTGGANTAFGNFATNNNIPFDLYNVESIEVLRGPNSNIFGLGASSGTVNVVPTQANPDRKSYSATVRFDDWGGHRESINLNQPLIPGKMAIRVAAVNEAKGYTRQPAAEEIHREFATMLYRPFKNTTIRLIGERYNNAHRRPNSITPRDTTAEWKANGSPTWDPTTMKYTLANGTVSPTAITSDALLPLGLKAGAQFPVVYFDGEALKYFSVQRANNLITTGVPSNPFSTANSTNRYLMSGTYIMKYRDVVGPTGLPLYIVPGTADKSIYDWSSTNVVSPNHGADRAETYSAELEQIIINTPQHMLAARVGAFSQKYDRLNYGYLDNLESVIYVDVNSKQLDGGTNPYFLRPYIQAGSGSINNNANDVRIESADLAYRLTPTKLPRWLSWIGQQSLGAHAEVTRTDELAYGRSARVSDDHEWINRANRVGTQRITQRFYLGDNVGQNVEYGPSAIDNIDGTYPLTWFNNRTGQWVNETVKVNELLDSGQGARRRTEVRTLNATLQSFFFNDRVVSTVGFRRDRQRSRTGAGAFVNSTTGLADLSNTGIFGPILNYNSGQPGASLISLPGWVDQSGDTKTLGVVLKATSWLNLHFNKSDSFTPQIVRQSLGLGNVNNPHGYSTEYGFSVTSPDGKFNLRLTHFVTKEMDSRGSEIGTLGNRYLDMEGRPDGSNSIQPPSFRYFATNIAKGRLAAAGNASPSAAELLTAVAKLMAPYPDQARSEEWLNRLMNSGPSQPQTVGTTDVSSKGFEVEATYNPTRNWRLKFTGSKTRAQDDRVSPEIYNWWQTRIPVWTTLRSDIVAGDGKGPLWWDTIPTGDSRTPQARYIQDQFGPFWAAATNEGRPRTQMREYRFTALTNYDFTTGKLKNFNIGGAVRWESKASIGFLAGAPETSGPYSGTVLFLDTNKPAWDKARYYVDLAAGYKFKLRSDKIQANVQLNIRDVLEDGRLQAIGINPDGAPYAYRIINPRQFILSMNFEL